VINAARAFTAGDAPNMRALNPEWDQAFLAKLQRDLRAVDAIGNDEITRDGGKSAHEIRTWVAAFGGLAAIEVVDSRIRGWDIRFVDTVADNASSGLFVLGSRPVPLSALDLSACAMTLERDGEVLSRGNGSACLGNPLNAAIWLADRMAQLGTPLRAGDVVLTGALGPMVTVAQPGTWTATIEGLGSVRATFA